MMAKKLQKSVVGTANVLTTYPVGKTVATTGAKTKKVDKVHAKPVSAKKPNKLVGRKTVKGGK